MTGDSFHVLVVDDDKFIRTIVVRMLSELGHRAILEAGNGSEGLTSLHAAQPPVGLVILDLEMPLFDGFHFLRALRNDASIPDPNLPVVVLTGHADLKNIHEAAAIGIHGFLVKPVSKASLEKQMRKALSSPPIDPARIPNE